VAVPATAGHRGTRATFRKHSRHIGEALASHCRGACATLQRRVRHIREAPASHFGGTRVTSRLTDADTPAFDGDSLYGDRLEVIRLGGKMCKASNVRTVFRPRVGLRALPAARSPTD
jgi:hypothetical protein